MVINRQDLRHVGIDEFIYPLQSFGIKKNNLSGEILKYKYTKDFSYKAY